MSKLGQRFPLNLQYFAEEEGAESVNNPEVAEPDEVETEGAEVDEVADVQTEEKPVQSPEVNAQFAAARRQAEEQLRARDRRYAERFGHLTNPITGKPIQNENDYFEALDAQADLARKQQLEQQGVDEQLLEELIANNPTVKQAQLVMEQTKQQEEVRRFEADMKAIHAMDSAINTIDDLLATPNSQTVLEKVRQGYSLPDAYKVVNFDRLSSQSAQASKQAAINALKSKSHMTQTGGVSDTSSDVDIPQSELAGWRAMFPDASDKELKAKYNRATNAIG